MELKHTEPSTVRNIMIPAAAVTAKRLLMDHVNKSC
jgi:hypothetical protein